MVLNKKFLALILIYGSTVIFYLIVLFFPFRIIYTVWDLGFYNISDVLLVAENIGMYRSRGTIPFLVGLISFGLSVLFFLIFNKDRNPKFAKIGYFFSLCSVIALILTVTMFLLIYSNQLIDYLPILIIIGIIITEINIGTIFFIKRNDLE